MSETRHGDASLTHEGLAILAHEIRGALTAISGFTELLRRPLSEEDREKALSGIHRAAVRIDGLLDSAASGGPVGATRLQPLDMRALVERVVEDQRSISGRKVSFAVQDDATVLGTPDSLERALGNLVDNALKYSGARTEVEVCLGREGSDAVVDVLDRGPGVPRGNAESIFEPFERLDNGSVYGTGLGLTVVKSVAEAHGGGVSVSDRSGGGSIFRLRLPLAPTGR